MKGVSGLKAGHSKVIYFITDALGSVRDIVSGTDGAVLQSYEYTENGEKTVTLDGGIQNWKTWIGGQSVQDETADTDLYLMGHRWYSASAGGRFLSRDPIGFAGGMNLYSYSANSPVDMVDPEGLRPPYSRMEHILGREMPDEPLGQKDVEFFSATITAVGMISAAPATATAGGYFLFRAGMKRAGVRLMALGAEGSSGGIAVAGASNAGRRAYGRGTGNPANRAAVYNGNEMHYDCLNGGQGYAGSGVGAPTQLQNRFPDTQFRFPPRGAAGVDVTVAGGTHPSQYSGSTWPTGVMTADFKPYTASGMNAVPREILSGKLPPGTLPIYYEPYNGVLRTP